MTVGFRLFSVFFVLTCGMAVLSSVLYLDATMIMAAEREVELPLFERVVMALHNGFLRYVAGWVAFGLSEAPLLAVAGWCVRGRGRPGREGERAALALWLGGVALSLGLGYGTWAAGNVLGSLPLLMGGMLIGPASWALTGALYNALSVQHGRHVATASRLPAMTLAAVAVICLVADSLFVGGLLSWALAVIPMFVWWQTRSPLGTV